MSPIDDRLTYQSHPGRQPMKSVLTIPDSIFKALQMFRSVLSMTKHKQPTSLKFPIYLSVSSTTLSMMYKSINFILLLLLSYGYSQEPRVDPLVETKLGLIRGFNSDDGSYAKFLGIPYAVVDVARPFAPSIPQGTFNETFNAFDDSIVCPQSQRDGSITGQIQCLNLNVYVPNAASTQNPLPVMVHIHGGAFVGGDSRGMGTPDNLIKHNVVFVSINYRLGIYGFFCTDSPNAPGNIGLKDQLLALRWVRENIDAFSGNPNQVTVFGESAGAMSIHLHLLSPHEKLFERAIIESGPATSPLTVVQLDNNLPLRLSADLGFVTESVDEALDFIARADVHLAIAAGENLHSNTIYSNEPLTKACVEREFEGVDRFVTENPNDIKPEKVKIIPIIIGYASQEMKLQHGNKNEEYFNNYPFDQILSFGFKLEDSEEMINTLKNFYIGDTPPNIGLANEITSYASDFTFNHPVERAIQNMMVVGPKAVYQYVFSYEGDPMFENVANITGASHTSESMYLFKSDRLDEVEHADVIARLTTMWTNFAKYGDPTPEIYDLLPVKWEPATRDTRPYLDIDKDLTLKSRPFHERMAFWDLFYKVNAKQTLWYEGGD